MTGIAIDTLQVKHKNGKPIIEFDSVVDTAKYSKKLSLSNRKKKEVSAVFFVTVITSQPKS